MTQVSNAELPVALQGEDGRREILSYFLVIIATDCLFLFVLCFERLAAPGLPAGFKRGAWVVPLITK